VVKNPNRVLQSIGKNSFISLNDIDRELIILVIGETARRDRFSLNGYKKETNPLLKQENIYSFTNVTSCGTSTAVSVPCIFSHFGRKNFAVEDARGIENLLDVLGHTKRVSLLWRDNNSDSKGVAARIAYEDYKTSKSNTICDSECRDEGMLVGLQGYIDSVKENDIVIVLHQMGNHGPAYYKRYPKEFAHFKPYCETNDLSKCSNEEIDNAYDNAIRYTDLFLSKTISLLKNNSSKFSTVMVYVSDHGESLGENGVYLHSMPYMIAPKEQIEVPLIMWFGGDIETELKKDFLKERLNHPFSHDNIFHTVLSLMEIESSVLNPELDILNKIQIHGSSKIKN
jgi:lipid A ethanolaminephosphotransferase